MSLIERFQPFNELGRVLREFTGMPAPAQTYLVIFRVMMTWPFHNSKLSRYWLRVFGLYVITEAFLQLTFFFLINQFGERPICNIELHFVMWIFQCLLIWPIWWMANALYKKKISTQIVGNLLFFIVYILAWLGLMQDGVRGFHQFLQVITRPPEERLPSFIDTSSYFHFHVLKHCFRLSWFFLANYFYNYREEEVKRRELVLANKELELKLLTWRLNPNFYLQAIHHLQHLAAQKPTTCTRPILELSRVMEYVIYEAKEKMISVSKEMLFLKSYIDLLNKQGNGNAKISFTQSGSFDKLHISPLLLVGFIDKLPVNENAKEVYKLNLEFRGQWLHISIEGRLCESGHSFLSADDPLHKRMAMLYSSRFLQEKSDGSNVFDLKIQLDEQA